jgi:hypothetical protein
MYLIIWIYMFYPFFCCTESPATCNSVQSRFARPMYISLPVEVLTQIESRLQLTNSVHIRKNATKNITTIGADTELQNNKWPDIKKTGCSRSQIAIYTHSTKSNSFIELN